MYAVVAGNPADGFVLYGPFESAQAAIDRADEPGAVTIDPWWVMELIRPS
jgi:hypothetical protein